ncbi:MAG: carbamoyltransferase, partial [Patescibacteria group bacterium]
DWLGQKIKVEQIIRRELGFRGNLKFIPHHLSHAAATYFTSGFTESAILTIDGVGEYQTTGLWKAKNNEIKALGAINFPHSLGLLYSTFTAFLGFKVNEDEYKLMGLAAYGKPVYAAKVRRLIEVKPDGSFALDLSYFSFRESFQMWNEKFERLLGKPRRASEPILRRHKDLAASIQKVTEETYLAALNHLSQITGCANLCVSGGVGLNALANGQIYSQTPFKKVHILGSAGDSGAAIGSALYTYHATLGRPRRNTLTSLSLGSRYTNSEIEMVLQRFPVTYQKFKAEKELIQRTVQLLSQGKIVGWFWDRCEYGPRALGHRSILALPRPRQMKERVNVIKRREQFRPFAASILEKHVHEYFIVPEKKHASPFMIFCFAVKKEKRKEIAAVVHRDNTCRVQTVSPVNGRYYLLLKEFYRQTGIPCILNTSFNLKGEPIVESPQQAIADFVKTQMDYLVIGDFLVSKTNQ